MTGWPLVPLADCCDIVSGATPKTSVETYWGGDIDWVTPKDLSGLDGAYIHRTPRRITKAGLVSCGANVLPPQSVLFSSRAPIGHVAINTVPMATNQGFKSLIPHANRVDAKYLFHWMKANRAYLESLGNGATFKEVSKSIVSRVEIPLPPFAEQRRIAAILDEADALRAKRRETLDHLDHLAESIFVDLFGHEVDDAQSWPREPLKDLVEVITKGTTPTSVGFQFTESGVPFVRVQNLVGGTVDFAPGALFIDSKTHVALKRSRILPGDILVSIAGTIGRTSIVPLDAKEMNCNQAVAIVRLKTGVNRHFVRAWLSSADAHRQVSASAVTATISNLSLSQLGLLQIIQPPASLQDEFSDRLGSARALKDRCAKSQLRIESLFASLQSRAFAGEL